MNPKPVKRLPTKRQKNPSTDEPVRTSASAPLSASPASPVARRTAVQQSLMLRMTRERVTHLARELLDRLTRTQSVTLLKDREVVRQSIAHTLADEFKREEEREETVRKKLAAVRKGPAPGSREYEQLFRNLMDEEYLREGLDT